MRWRKLDQFLTCLPQQVGDTFVEFGKHGGSRSGAFKLRYLLSHVDISQDLLAA